MADRALPLLHALVLDDGRRWGEVAADFQRDDAAAVVAPSGPRLHFLTRPRGGSKTTDVGGLALALLVEEAPPGAACFAFGADKDQAALLLDSIAGFVRRTPGLAGELEVQTWRIIDRASGASLTVMPADGPGSFGLRPWLTVVDEFANWKATAAPRQVWEAVVSAVPKMPGSRLVVISTAGDPASWQAKVRDQAKRSKQWRLVEVPGPLPWIDPEALEEQQALLLPSQYARLHLNQWLAAEDRLTTTSDLRACVTLDGPQEPEPGTHYVIALDVGLSKDRTVAAVCHATDEAGERTVVLDRMEVWQGRKAAQVQLSLVEEWLLEASRAYNRAPVVFDPFQAVGTAQRLRRAGVTAEQFTFSSASVGRLAHTLYQLLRNHRLALPDDAELLDELANVRLHETSPGVVRMDHDADKHDDRAVTLAMAAQHLLSRPGRRTMRFRGTTAVDRLPYGRNDDGTVRVPPRDGRPGLVIHPRQS